MANFLTFDADGYCIAKYGNTDVTITQDTPVEVSSLADYSGMDWIYENSAIRAMTEEESRLRRRKLKSTKLQTAEVAYESFLGLLSLPIKADSNDIMGALIQMKATGATLPYAGVQLNPSEIQGIISGLMHDIEVNGGSWETL